MKRELTLTDMDGHTAVQTCKVCGCTKDNPCYHEKLGMPGKYPETALPIV